MIEWLESLSSVAAGIVIVGGFVGSSLALGYLVAIFTSREVRSEHNELAGFILAVIGVIYAVLLAFVAISVWERFEQAQTRSYDEADALATVYRDAESFPNPGPLRAILRAHVHRLVDVEWAQMSRGERPPLFAPGLEAADHYVRHLPVKTPAQAQVQAQMLAAMDDALRDRETRLTIDFSGINGTMWMVLIVGAYITVGFTYLFGFERTVMQQLMIGGLSLMIGVVLFLVVALDYPFRGNIAVEPSAFRALLESWSITKG
jgi:hypothetical protein